jgi:nitroimidazol reductase NimA-like FMN-containing flavoprotein (pyridoxamine 5'-phosphate oxidase superfamily)
VAERAEAAAVARAIVDANRYLTLGTADDSGLPWATPVYFAVDGYGEYFRLSAPEARHSRNLAVRPEAGIVIFDSRVPIGTGQAVYVSAITDQVPEADLERALEIYSRRSVADGGRVWGTEHVLPPARHRLYRATAREHFVLDPHDERVAVDLAATE